MIGVLIGIIVGFATGLALTIFADPSFVVIVGTTILALIVWFMLRNAKIRPHPALGDETRSRAVTLPAVEKVRR